MKIFDWLYRLLCLVLGCLFLYSGAMKLLDLEVFAVLIDAYGLLPGALVMPAALALSALEVIAGAGILLDARGSLGLTTCLLLMFTAVLVYGLRMGLDVDCGCFGAGDPEAEAFHGLAAALYRDIVMLSGIAYLYGWRWYRSIRPHPLRLIIHMFWKRREKGNAYS